MPHPTRAEWDAAIEAGFRSDGASFSPDTILGISIANADNSWPPKPADLHDFRYFLGGTEEDRREADAEFLKGLYACVDHLEGRRLAVARRRCGLYFHAVDDNGWRFWGKLDRGLRELGEQVG